MLSRPEIRGKLGHKHSLRSHIAFSKPALCLFQGHNGELGSEGAHGETQHQERMTEERLCEVSPSLNWDNYGATSVCHG